MCTKKLSLSLCEMRTVKMTGCMYLLAKDSGIYVRKLNTKSLAHTPLKLKHLLKLKPEIGFRITLVGNTLGNTVVFRNKSCKTSTCKQDSSAEINN